MTSSSRFNVLSLTFALSIVCSPASWSAEKFILVSHGGLGNPFWTVVFAGAKQAAQDLKADLQILSPNRDGDQPGTTQKLSEAVSTHPAGIAVTLASGAHCEYIKEARKKQIPLVVYNARAVPSDAKCPYQAYIGMDEYQAGRASAERALTTGKLPAAPYRIMIGLTEAGHSGQQARAKGVTDVFKKLAIKADTIDLGNDPAAIPARLKGYAQKNPDLAGFFIPSPQGMHPILRMMEEDRGGLGKKYAAAFDLTPLILKGIETGLIDHSVDQQPWLQGYMAVQQLVMAARYRFIPANFDTGVGVATRENVGAISELVKKGIR